MTETSTQALIAEALKHRDWLRGNHMRPLTMNAAELLDRLAAELARLSTPPSDARSDGIKRHLPSADWLRQRIETDPDLDCEAGRPLEAAGAIGETVPTREAVARVIYPRFSRSPTSLSADNQAISALRKADAILALISPPSSTNRAGAGE